MLLECRWFAIPNNVLLSLHAKEVGPDGSTKQSRAAGGRKAKGKKGALRAAAAEEEEELFHREYLQVGRLAVAAACLCVGS